MKIVFFSNYFNHHQEPFCLALYKFLGEDFRFVATEPFNQKRLALGYEDMNNKYEFITCNYKGNEHPDEVDKLIDSADLIIDGTANSVYAQKCFAKNKPVMRYSERLMKDKLPWYKKIAARKYMRRFYSSKTPNYLLCAGAYVAKDYNSLGLFKNKCYTWGYFPETHIYDDVESLLDSKHKASLLWVGRLIDWKHPETVITIAQRLKADGYSFRFDVVGTGDMEDTLAKQISEKCLDDNVKLHGSMSPAEVRTMMERSEIFLFTSDRKEGWGAVLNESMNSCCAVIANNEIGSVPFLVKDGENGFVYNNGNIDELYDKVKQLLSDPGKRRALGINAYNTITRLWNADTAAERILALAENLINGKSSPYIDGPCSKLK